MFKYSNGLICMSSKFTVHKQSFWIQKIERNALTSRALLRRLACSPNVEVRIAVCDHVNSSLQILQKLASDENTDVRFALAENHNLDREILETLTNDANPYVAQRALKTLLRAYPSGLKEFSIWPLSAALAAS